LASAGLYRSCLMGRRVGQRRRHFAPCTPEWLEKFQSDQN
jgi:hypothetical protein